MFDYGTFLHTRDISIPAGAVETNGFGQSTGLRIVRVGASALVVTGETGVAILADAVGGT